MTRQVLYVAAPLRPTEEEIEAHRHAGWMGPLTTDEMCKLALRANIDRAMRWLAWLRRSFPETTFIAPWIASVLARADDADASQREAGFVDDCAVVERCDGIVLCGGRICSGMRREMEHGRAHHSIWLDDVQLNPDRVENGFQVYDLVTGCPFQEAPSTPARPWIAFKDWARRAAAPIAYGIDPGPGVAYGFSPAPRTALRRCDGEHAAPSCFDPQCWIGPG